MAVYESRNPSSAPSELFDVAIVGGGVSGAALFYALARYASVPRLALFEKYDRPGLVNSDPHNNSQTLHVGDIETNYSVEKVRQVYPAAMMVKRYTDTLSPDRRSSIIAPVEKMVLAVGEQEVQILKDRAAALEAIFPELRGLDGAAIAAVEPEVMRGRREEAVFALSNPGYAVNYGELARSFIEEAARGTSHTQTFFGTEITRVEAIDGGYRLSTKGGSYEARVVVFDTDAYSLHFAKQLGLGREFSLIPIAGSFYFTPQKLNGKVYRVQDPRMPFAAVHGDPELTEDGVTRWGPTARFYPVLEARKISSMGRFFSASGFGRLATWLSFGSILLEPVRFWYLIKNFFYDLPLVGTLLLLPQLRKVVPTLRWSEVARAQGYGGMRLQRVDVRTRELLLGEGKIVGENIIFNMSPSPGASVCLYNAMRDAETIAEFLPEIRFDKVHLLRDLYGPGRLPANDVSLPESYAS